MNSTALSTIPSPQTATSIVDVKDTAAAGPFCVDCSHARFKVGPGWICAAPTIDKTFDLITGNQIGPTCRKQRDSDGDCSPLGLLFDEKAVSTNPNYSVQNINFTRINFMKTSLKHRDSFAAVRNIFRAFWRYSTTVGINAQPPNCTNIMTLLAHLCDMDDEMRLWVLRWLAYPLRNPGAKMSRAVVINGSQGTGKSLFFSHVVAELYACNAARIRPSDLNGRFNSWARSANMVIAEGGYSHHSFEQLKALITMDSIPLEIRGQESRRITNRLNFVFVSSRDDFLPLEANNRRLVIIEAPPARPQSFYKAIAHEIANGGVDAFRDYLMRGLDMGDFDHLTPPPMQTFAPAERQAA